MLTRTEIKTKKAEFNSRKGELFLGDDFGYLDTSLHKCDNEKLRRNLNGCKLSTLLSTKARSDEWK